MKTKQRRKGGRGGGKTVEGGEEVNIKRESCIDLGQDVEIREVHVPCTKGQNFKMGILRLRQLIKNDF